MTVTAPAGRGLTIWFTGLSGAGRSALAAALAPRLRAFGKRVEVLDGGVMRGRGVGDVARLLTRNGVFVIAAAVDPDREARDRCRETIRDFIEVCVDAPSGMVEGALEDPVDRVVARLRELGRIPLRLS